MGLLDGCRALVTGGGSGIGAATCRRMSEEGAAVAVLDIDADAAAKVAADVDGISYGVDVTDYPAVEAACRDAASQLGGLTTLYNNAGSSSMAGVARVGSRGVGSHRQAQPHRRVPRLPCRGPADARDRCRPRAARDRLHLVDQRHAAVRWRGALRGGEGRRRRAHRDGGAGVRPGHPGERGRLPA